MPKPAAGTPLNTGHALASGLSLYCPLLEGSGGTVTDLVAGNNGTYNGVAAIWDSNADGPTLRFRHEDASHVGWASPLSAWKTHPITVTVRCKRRGPGSGQFDGIAGLTDGSTVGWQIPLSPLISSGGFADETWFVQTYGGGGGFATGNSMVLDDWVTITFTHNGTTIHVYEDGVELGTGSAAAGIAPSSANLGLGRRLMDGSSDNTFHGDVECFAIWSRVLSAAEVADFASDPYQVLGTSSEPLASDEEFVGPFDNWRDVKVDYGAAGNGTGNDQTAFAAAVADMLSGVFHHLWVPAGDYRFTTGLYMQGLDRVSIIGEDPETTRIFWDAATTPFMALINMEGTHYSRINRLELDGNDLAWCVLRVDGMGTGGFFPTGNEFTDLHIHNAGGTDQGDGHTWGAGVRLQAIENVGVSEAMFKRCHIHDNLTIDLMCGGFNTLDIWLRDCWFHDTPISVGNHSRIQTGAGNFHGYDCLFENASDACILIGNTQGHNFERCWFRNSNRVYDSYGVGASSPTSFKHCTALDIAQIIAFSQSNSGPMFFFDNVVRSLAGVTNYVVGSPNLVRDGNIFSSPGQGAGTQELNLGGDSTVDRATITPTWPTWRGYQVRTSRTIFEVAPGASTATIQTAITNAIAAGPRSVVHFQGNDGAPPSHSITATLEVPPSSIQLIGDGRRTELKWTVGGSGPIINFQGPGAQPTCRELRFHGNDTADAIHMYDADQVDGLILMEQPFAEQCMVGLRFDHLTDTKVELRGDGAGSTGVGPPAGTGVYINAAEVVQWGGAYGTNWNTCWTVSGGARVAIFHAWYEGEPPEEIALGVGSAFGDGFPCGVFVRWGGIEVAPDANHAGNVGPDTATVHIQDFQGRVSMVGCGLGVLCNVRRWASRHDAPLLVLGQTGTLRPYYTDEHPNSRAAMLASQRNTTAGAPDEPTYSVGTAIPISDVLTKLTTGQRAAFVKEQLEWPRSLSMVDLRSKAYASEVTNAQFYRVDFTRCINGIDVRGTIPSLSGSPSPSDAYAQQVTWLVADAQVATFKKHAAFIDPVGGAAMVMPALAATGAPGTRTHRWCRWRMTTLQQEELEGRLASQITATTVKVYDAGETPTAVLAANTLVKM